MAVPPRILYQMAFWWMLSNSVAVSQSSPLWFKRLSMEDGLPSSHVSCIFQDSKGFMWFGTWKGLCRYDGYTFKVYSHQTEDSSSPVGNMVFKIIEDPIGNIWAVMDKELEMFDPINETFTHYFQDRSEKTNYKISISDICLDKLGNIWVGTNDGLYHLDTKIGKFLPYEIHNPDFKGPHFIVNKIFCAADGTLWMGTSDGLMALYPETGIFFLFGAKLGSSRFSSTSISNFIYDILQDKDGVLYFFNNMGLDKYKPGDREYNFEHSQFSGYWAFQDKLDESWWVATSEGLVRRIPPDLQDIETVRPEFANNEGLSSGKIITLFQDKEGSIWIGTDNGINILTPEGRAFRHYKNHNGDIKNSISNKFYSVFGGKNGEVWLGSDFEGVSCLDPQTGMVRRFFVQDGAFGRPINFRMAYRIYEDRQGSVWMALNNMEIYKLDRRNNIFRHIQKPDFLGEVYCFYEDNENIFWLGHRNGMARYDRTSNQFDFMHYAPVLVAAPSYIRAIFQDHTGAYWVATTGNSLNKFDPATRLFRPYLPNPNDPGSIMDTRVKAIYEDKKGQLWVSTAAGLESYMREKDSFQHYKFNNGSTYDLIGRILEDGKGHLWMATTKGLMRFDPVAGTFKSFNKIDGLSSDECWDFARSPKTGAFLLATSDGLTIFHPDSLWENTLAPSVVFTKITRFDATSGKTIEEKGVSSQQEWTFSYKDDALMFEFAALSYRKFEKIEFAYKLEGLNPQWISLGKKHDLTFTDLSPGAYVLRVKASNGDGVWNETGTAIKITILPPWWASWPALLFYAMAAVCLFYWIYRFQLGRKLAAAENRRLKELDTLKTRLYTNITHEFRTPLTVIGGMAQQIKEDPDRWIEEGPDIIQRNSDGLLRLVNQMLELSKLEAGMLPVHLEQRDVVAYLKYLLESFHSFADAKGITLSMESQWDDFVMDFDADKILHIISNLVSNAIKFTPNGGKVTLSCSTRLPDSKQIDICIRDTGIGIPAEELLHIFEPFHQVDGTTGGSGIGLTLARELVLLLGGAIGVESTQGEGSVFTVTLPVSRTAPATQKPTEQTRPAHLYMAPAETEAQPQGPSQAPLIQIVEDNADVVRYLRACLEQDYRVVTASNGKAAVEQAFADIPDIIVSDVMMPEMDGYELCGILKNDERTSHIPVILLTARADMDSRLHGLQQGADAYLAKPFNKEELLVQIRNLLEVRRSLQTYYLALASQKDGQASSDARPENPFIQKLSAIVGDHLADSSFDVARLCREAGMSNSNLHRKLTALTGRSANEFIRHIRLTKACTLLKDPDLTIAAVAYDCGFNDPVYFARVFRQEFGVSPSEWRGGNMH